MYGYRKIRDDLRALGEACGEHKVERRMKLEGLQAQVGYGRHPRMKGGKPSHVASNGLEQQFVAPAANTHGATDITYLRAYEGWLYLAVVVDLFSRQIVGWSMQPRMQSDLVSRCGFLARAIPSSHGSSMPSTSR